MTRIRVLVIFAVIGVCTANKAEIPGKLDEAVARPYDLSIARHNGIQNTDSSSEEDADNVEYNSMETDNNSDGSGLSESSMEQVIAQFFGPVKRTSQPSEEDNAPIEQNLNGPAYEHLGFAAQPNEPSGNENDLRVMHQRAHIRRVLHNMRLMAQQNSNAEGMLGGIMAGVSPAMTPASEETAADQGDEDIMPHVHPYRYEEQMRPIKPQDVIEEQVPDGLLNDQASGLPESSFTGGVAIVFVPVWRIIEKTVIFVSRQPSDDLEDGDEMSSASVDVFFAFLMGLICITLALMLIFVIHRTLRRRRERAMFSQSKGPVFSPPAYAQPPQLTSLTTTKIDGNSTPQKPPLEPGKV